jgi:hypothetical protein
VLDGGDHEVPAAGGVAVEGPADREVVGLAPPEVKTSSPAAHPSADATRSRASSTAARAARPVACADDGLPKTSSRRGSIAARTSGAIGVVAAWSR